jgi:hypothetical protein
MYDYALWGDDYDTSFWGYGYDDIYAGMFTPYGYECRSRIFRERSASAR